MSKTQDSKDKKILQKINFKEFSELCSEYNEVKKSLQKLIKIRDDNETPVRVQVDISKWIIEMNVGKPKQIQELDLNKPVTLEELIACFDEDPHTTGEGYEAEQYEDCERDKNGFIINPNFNKTNNE